MNKIFLGALLLLGLGAGCDTTVIEGDTTVIIVTGDGASLDSLGVGDVLPPGDGLPQGDFGAPETAFQGVWKLVEVQRASTGSLQTVEGRQETEIGAFQFAGAVVFVVPRSFFALAVCRALFESGESVTLTWEGGAIGCRELQSTTTEVTFEIRGDKLWWLSSNTGALAAIGTFIAKDYDSTVDDPGLPSEVSALVFSKISQDCRYVGC